METRSTYDKLYTENESAFSSEPQECVGRILDHKHGGTVLEIGAGDGRNALFLAKHGFDVTAQDISPVGIENLNKRAQALGVSVEAEVADARGEIQRPYDVIVSTFVLHHLHHEDALDLIARMQERTLQGGLNVLTVFTKQGDFYRNDTDTTHFYANQYELRELYHDWEVVECREVEGPARKKKPDGSAMRNTWVELVARKRAAP